MLLLPAPKPKKALEVPVVFDAPAVTPANKLIVPGELKRRAPPMLYWTTALTMFPESDPLAVPLPLMLKVLLDC